MDMNTAPISLAEAARRTGLNRATLRSYAVRGLLPVLRTPTGTMRVRLVDLEQLMRTPMDEGTRIRK